MLWSAYYPCQHRLRTLIRRLPQGLTAPPTLSLVGAASADSPSLFDPDGFVRRLLRLRGWPFPFTSPGPVLGPSRFPQLRPCGVLWSARYPCQSLGPDSTPDSFACRSGNTLTRLLRPYRIVQAAWTLSRRLFPLACPGPDKGLFSLSSVEILRRALVCTNPCHNSQIDLMNRFFGLLWV